ncbi:hypothetical protein Glove_103g206 [Diversispora epigaea]|uniref:Uncharacterized protein n=1 Tax=Diversispora epigaea TaxID=1348612 RepID=A0A397J5P3_9GLOM|nr:hypothetical protein Glove_103g206 [Diversispora epigaea]
MREAKINFGFSSEICEHHAKIVIDEAESSKFNSRNCPQKKKSKSSHYTTASGESKPDLNFEEFTKTYADKDDSAKPSSKKRITSSHLSKQDIEAIVFAEQLKAGIKKVNSHIARMLNLRSQRHLPIPPQEIVSPEESNLHLTLNPIPLKKNELGIEDDTYAPVSKRELKKSVLYFSEVSRNIDHGGDYSLIALGTVADHSAIKANTYDGGQYLIERVKSDNPKESTDINKIIKKGNGVWKLDEFHHCDEGVTLGQLKDTAFSGKPYNLLTANCQQATGQVVNKHSSSSASNEQPLDGRVDQE